LSDFVKNIDHGHFDFSFFDSLIHSLFCGGSVREYLQ